MRHTMLHEQLRTFYNGFRRDAHPMAVMCGVVGALSAFYHDSLDIHDPESRRISAFRLVAKVPTIAAWAYKYSIGQPFVYPRNDLSYAENFLHMFHAVPAEEYKVNPVLSKAMDLIMILHADHEQNASTSTVRLAGSTGANPFACIAAGIASLWGPAHGGANEAVLKMLTQIGSAKNIPAFLEDVKSRSSHEMLWGFGHRVYKNYDPRAKIIQKACHDVLQELGIKGDPLLDLAMELEKIALNDKYFIDRKLYPNVDFYSGIILKAMGFPTSMFTALFAVSRTVGWVCAVERDDGRSGTAHQPPAAGLHRRAATRLRADHETELRFGTLRNAATARNPGSWPFRVGRRARRWLRPPADRPSGRPEPARGSSSGCPRKSCGPVHASAKPPIRSSSAHCARSPAYRCGTRT